MASALLGFWEILGCSRVKAPVECARCSEEIEQFALRCVFSPFTGAPLPYHLACAARAGEEGAAAPLTSGCVRKKSGLTKPQLSEVNELLEAAEAAGGAATPAKDASVAAAGEPTSAEKEAQDPAKPPKKAKKAKQLHDDPPGGPEEPAEPPKKKAKGKAAGAKAAAAPPAPPASAPAAAEPPALAASSPEELVGPITKKPKAKAACAAKAKPKAKPAAKPVAEPVAESAVPAAEGAGQAGAVAPPPAAAPGAPAAGGGARHLAGLVPSAAYMPIKDFARGVKPAGTATEVFEREVVPSFGLKLGPWLSEEAQKVAASILKAGNGGDLTPQMVYSVVLYTLDARLAGGTLKDNFYSALNESLQQRDMKVLSKIEGYLHYFMSALEKLPAEPERVYFRGVPKSAYDVVRQNYARGRRIHWSGISSISEDEHVSTNFAQAEGAAKGDGPGGVVFRITARTGRKIQHLSALPAEAEVLLLPNFRGFVTRGLYRTGKVWSIDILEEADDSGTFVF